MAKISAKPKDIFVPLHDEEALRCALDALPGLGVFEQDLKGQMDATARSAIQHIIDVMEDNYRKSYEVAIMPRPVWKIMRTRAYLCYVRHCARLMKDLKAAAFDPNMKF